MIEKEKVSQNQYIQLCSEIIEYNRYYFDLNSPIISDYEYDQKIKQLLYIEKLHPEWIVPWSPSFQRFGDSVHPKRVLEHIHPMLSIPNVYSFEDVQDFFIKTEKTLGYAPLYVLEFKIDGIAVALRYEHGKFIQALTRGNGLQGEDITENIRTIRSLPLELQGVPSFIEMRGEVFLTYEAFEEMNEQQIAIGKSVFANPRNAASGTLKLLSSEEVAKRNLSLSIYSCRLEQTSSHYEALVLCQQWGMPVFGRPKQCYSLDDIFETLQEVEKIRNKLPMPIDGVVIKVDKTDDQTRLGITSKHYRWALAYKYAPEQALTIVEDIIVQVGKTGVLTPVAQLKPIALAGTIVSRASLYNEEEVERKDIRIGDSVYVEKGGEIIPKIVSVCLDLRPAHSEKWSMPTQCPICFGEIVKGVNKVASRCINPFCSAGAIEKLRFFVGKDGFDIDYLGEKVISRLFEKGLVQKYSDIFLLTKEDIEQIPGYKEKSIRNLLNSIRDSKSIELNQFLCALSIPYVGKTGALILAEHYGSLDAILQASFQSLISIHGIGERVAQSIVDFFRNEKNLAEIAIMRDLGVQVLNYEKKDWVCNGKTFVFTGSLQKMSRSDAEKQIVLRGGKISSSVSKNTDFLVVGENPGSKLEKAQQLSIQIVNEEELLSFLYK